MSTIGWFRPTIGRTSLPTLLVNPKTLKLRASFIEYPLASKIIVRISEMPAILDVTLLVSLNADDLSYSTSEGCLKKEFSTFGQIAEVKLVTDETTKKSKGYAFVQYTNQDDAMNALESMDEKYLDGRVIFVELAKPGNDRHAACPKTSGPPQRPPFSTQKEAEND